MQKLLILLIFIIGLSSCNEYTKILKSDDHEYKTEKAIEYYNNKKYDKSLALFEAVIPYQRLSPNFEELYFKYAFSNYHVGDYYLANYYFKSFAKQFPNSQYAEESLFLAAICSVKNSPNYLLDQTETQSAIDELQLFMNRYPLSPKKDTCNKIVDQLVSKLEKKAYENAYLYYKTENYKSAVIAFKSVLEDFPASKMKNEVMLLIVKAGYKYADLSIAEKKEERYKETMKNYNNFASLFTNPEKKADAEQYYNYCIRELEEKEVK